MPDLNLLITLDVLLAEGSVARAAKRLQLSPSAMSRALARLRETTGDPLLVRAGRGLVPTPRALALREQVSRLVQDAHAVLRPAQSLDLAQVARTFTLRTSEEFVENFGPALLARIAREAPGIRLRFVSRTDKDSTLLREGSVDLETGVVDPTASPEVLTQALFRDRLVGVVRSGHPLSQGEVSAQRFAEGRHVYVSRRGRARGQVDDALQALGLTRQISTIVAGFATAIALARDTDLIASVPERYTAHQREGLHSFALPLTLPPFTVAMLWHPRLDADLAHRWLRGCLREVCGQ
ncbi:DNA-binding transcriptional regulator, LysR family [Pseudomonas grimontii]|uniref:DNA-binding transcriptional regulator, LysR family n=1 Tax=Pseudomonas grimontii TaxID=129847 RepID=A0A1H1HKX3_9PSED|nr:LysR family transcriptional regulator [Pseudomonas grimontii]TWR59531.1 LysR family transcriptional regulator [Pseudomonas grimontii]SDR26175.1 DNA-binding transcriptional regulator, LysR family [Pseudomonas grimontii]